jgi:phosphoribosylformylglycinamidine synthase
MNCEDETVRALSTVGLSAETLRSNEPSRRLEAFDGYVLPGGFSYEDRIRSGVVAARQKAMEVVARAAESGRPILGICNGAQILLEAGLVPGISPGRIEMALALNDSGTRVGYYCDWRFVTGELFDEPTPLPFAHAEGRFVTEDPEIRREVLARGLVVARYCDEEGRVRSEWPVNPNGAWENAAAMRNVAGNVLAIMPHPERANWAWQVPPDLPGAWAARKRAGGAAWREARGPGRVIFERFAEMLKGAAV